MRSLHSEDRNLFFNYDRGKLIGEQTKDNLLIWDKEGTHQKFEQVPIPSGTDQNIFFRVNKTLQPTLFTRMLSGVADPLSSTIAQLPKTAKERQASEIVKSIEGVLSTFRGFITSEQKDALGAPILDPTTNLPLLQIRSLQDVMTVAHQAILDVYRVASVPVQPNFLIIINSFTANSSILVVEGIRDLERLTPDMNIQTRTDKYNDLIIKERLRLDDQLADADPIAQAVVNVVDAQNINYTFAGQNGRNFAQRFMKPIRWTRSSTVTRSFLNQFIIRRMANTANVLRGHAGGAIGLNARSATMGRQFATNNYLDLDTLDFTPQVNVPAGQQ